MLWSLLPNALLPIRFDGIGAFLDRFVAEMMRPNAKVRPRQIDRLRSIIFGPAEAG
jgi:hypothetical protein